MLIAPTTTVDHSRYAVRSVTYRWDTGETVTDHDRTGTVYVELRVAHYKDAKQYVAHLWVVEQYGRFTRMALQIGGPRDGERPNHAYLAVEPTSRYSAKNLQAMAVGLLDAVRNGRTVRDDWRVRDILSRIPTVESCVECDEPVATRSGPDHRPGCPLYRTVPSEV